MTARDPERRVWGIRCLDALARVDSGLPFAGESEPWYIFWDVVAVVLALSSQQKMRCPTWTISSWLVDRSGRSRSCPNGQLCWRREGQGRRWLGTSRSRHQGHYRKRNLMSVSASESKSARRVAVCKPRLIKSLLFVSAQQSHMGAPSHFCFAELMTSRD